MKKFGSNLISDVDVAFPIVHGTNVEDGTLQGYLQTVGIPYVGSNVFASAVGQDKVFMKQIFESEHLPLKKYVWFYDYEYQEDEDKILADIKKLGYPVIVKPARLGSSVGITVAHDEKEIRESIEEAIKYDQKIIVEEMVKNLLEVDCAVLGNGEFMETSLIGEMITDNDFLTFEDKYIGKDGGKKGAKGPKTGGVISTGGFKIPADLDKDIEEKVYEAAKAAFRCMELKGVTRFDFLVDTKSREVYVNEPNTIPGCLAFFFYTPKGKKYTKLLDEMITTAIKDYKNSKKKVTSFESNVLSTYDGSKGSKSKMQ